MPTIMIHLVFLSSLGRFDSVVLRMALRFYVCCVLNAAHMRPDYEILASLSLSLFLSFVRTLIFYPCSWNATHGPTKFNEKHIFVYLFAHKAILPTNTRIYKYIYSYYYVYILYGVCIFLTLFRLLFSSALVCSEFGILISKK